MIVKIGNKYIGENHRCFLSAEAGTTCNGNLTLAKELADAALEAGMDAHIPKPVELLTVQETLIEFLISDDPASRSA